MTVLTFDDILKEQRDFYIGRDSNVIEIFGEDSEYFDLFGLVETNDDEPDVINPNDHPYYIYTYIYKHKESGRYVFVQNDMQVEYEHSEIIDIREVKKETKTIETINYN